MSRARSMRRLAASIRTTHATLAPRLADCPRVNAAVLHEHGEAPRYGPFEDPEPQPGTVVVDVAAAGLHHLDLLKASGSFYMGPPPLPSAVGTDGVGRLAGRPARVLRRDDRAVRVDGRARARARDRAVRVRRRARRRHRRGARQHRAGRLARGLVAVGARRRATPCSCSGAARSDRSRCRSRSCSARAASWRRTRGGERLERLLERGADATVGVGRAEDDLAAAYRTAAGGDLDVTIDTLWGAPATAAIEAAGRFARHVQVGHIAGPTITLPAPALRSVSLDLRGFRVDLPPPEQRRQGFLDLTSHVARRRHRRRRRRRSRSSRCRRHGSASAAPRAARSSCWFLDHATARLEWCRAAEGEEPTLSEIEAGRPVVLRGGTVLTMNDAHEILRGRRRARGRRGDRGRRPRASRCPRARWRSTRPTAS